MQYIPYLLCMLACPIGMGLMIWVGIRPEKKQMIFPGASTISQAVPHSSQENRLRSGPSPLKMIGDCAKMCLNWKILGGLALVGLAIGIMAPQWIWAALPFLLIAVCPLSMLVMLFSMHRMQSSQRQEQGQGECMACQMQQMPAQNEKRVKYVQGPRQVVTDGFPMA